MAHINVLVNDENDLFTVQLDSGNGFTELIVDGQSRGLEYSQTSAGPLQFIAKATNINIINPESVMYLQNQAGTKTYVCVIGYTGDTADQALNCIVTTFDVKFRDAQPGPIGFSQGNLTGTFGNT